jgi:hypothetical protein
MANVPLLSTGRDTAVYLDNSQVNRSAEKLQGEVLGAEKLKLNKALQEEQAFMKAIEVDPVALMTQAGIKQQSEKIDEFNKSWTEEMRRSKGILSTEQKIRMQQEKVGVQSFQQNLAGNQQRALEELKLYRSNPTKYNKDAFEGNFLNFLATGEYATGLQAAQGRLNKGLDDDIKAYFLTKPSKEVESINSKGGKVIATVTQGSQEEGKQRILSLIANDDTGGYLQDVVEEFMTLSPEEQKKVLDVDKSGTVTEDELDLSRQYGSAASLAGNPIVKWAMETKSGRYVSSDPRITNPPSSFNMTGGMSLSIDGKKYDYIPPTGQSFQLSNKTSSPEFYSINLPAKRSYKLTTDARKVKGGVEQPINKGTSINAVVIGYDAIGDNVLLQPESSDGSLSTTETIIVPRSTIETQMPQLYISKGGKNMLIGEGVATPKSGSGINWNK